MPALKLVNIQFLKILLKKLKFIGKVSEFVLKFECFI